jgi:hypothetical protein
MIFGDKKVAFARRLETTNRRSESYLTFIFDKNPLIPKSLDEAYVMYLSTSARAEETSDLMLTADIDFSKLHIFLVRKLLCKYRRKFL